MAEKEARAHPKAAPPIAALHHLQPVGVIMINMAT